MSKAVFEEVKGVLAVFRPDKGDRLAFEIVEGFGNKGIMMNKLTVVVSEACEFAYFFDIERLWPVKYGLDFGGVSKELARANDKTEVLYFLFVEITLFRVEVEVVFAHCLEDKTCAMDESGEGVGHDEEVIHVNEDIAFADEVLKGMVHEGLKGGRGITEAKEHDAWFV